MSTGGGGAGGERLGGIFFDIQGRTGDLYREFDRTQKQARQVEEELKRLKAQVKAGEIGYAEYAQKAAALAESKRRIQAESNRLRGAPDAESATVGRVSAATERYARSQGYLRDQHAQAGEGAGKAAYRLQQFGQTLDDLQYVGEMGLRPILNNLMSISSVLGITALAAYQLYTHWDQLMGVIGIGKVESEAEEMERLANATERTAHEEEKLRKYKEGQKSEERMSGLSDAAATSQKEFEDAIRNNEGGLKGLTDALASARNPGGLEARLTEEERRELEEARRMQYRKSRKLGDLTAAGYGGIAAGAPGAVPGLVYAAVTSEETSDRPEGLKREREILEKARERERERARSDIGKATGDASRQEGLINEIARVDPALASKLRGSTVGAVAGRDKEGDEAEQKEWRRQQEEAERRSVEENKASKAREDKAKKDLDKRATEAATAGQNRYLGQLLENNALGDRDARKMSDEEFRMKQVDEIRKHLLDTGQAKDEEEARQLGDLVAKKLHEGAWGAIRKRVNEEGIAPQEASDRMLDEHRAAEANRKLALEQKAGREEEAARRKKDQELREEERQRKMAVAKAEETLPGVDEKVRDAMIQGRLFSGGDAGGTNRQLEEVLGRELVDQGLTPEEAAKAAIEIVEKQSMKLSDDVVKRALQPKAVEAPQFLGAAEMVRKAQASVMKDVGKDQLDQLVMIQKATGKTNELLERMGNNRPRLGP